MMDLYSDIPMPPLDQRIETLSTKLQEKGYNPEKYRDIIENVCKNIRDYSLAGYCAFGITETFNEAVSQIQKLPSEK